MERDPDRRTSGVRSQHLTQLRAVTVNNHLAALCIPEISFYFWRFFFPAEGKNELISGNLVFL